MTAVATREQALALPTAEELAGSAIQDTGSQGSQKVSYPYIGFYGAKTQDTDPLETAGIEQHQFYLHNGLPIRVDPFECHVLRLGHYYTLVDDNVQPIEARLDCPDEAFKEGYRDHLFFVAAVRHGGTFYPAVGTLRAAQARAFDKTRPLLRKSKDEWAAMGPAAAASAHAALVGARCITTIWSKPEKTGTGRTQNKGYGVVRPTPKDQVDAFNAWYGEEANLKLVQALAGINAIRLDACRKLLG